jgi:hypothetical protein
MIYTVTCKKRKDETAPGALSAITGVVDSINFIGYNGADEIYVIETENDIDRLLDLSAGVIRYSVTAQEII